MSNTQIQRLEKELTDLIEDVVKNQNDYLMNDQIIHVKIHEVAKQILRKIGLPKSIGLSSR